jgi:hypothetical protein
MDEYTNCPACNHVINVHAAVGCLGANFQCSCVCNRDEVYRMISDGAASPIAVPAMVELCVVEGGSLR